MQSYRRFEIEVVFKDSDDRKADHATLDRIKGYADLSISVKKQKKGAISEAMNIIFNIDSGVVINIDDDAYVTRNWVKEHHALHTKHKEVGIATGLVHEVTPKTGKPNSINLLLNRQKWRINNFAAIDPPIDNKFAGYGMYIGRSGMLVDTGKRHNMINTFKQHGVNMSWKGDAVRGLVLPPYTAGGGRFEASAALQAIQEGYSSVWFARGECFHPLHESSSRSVSVASVPLEIVLDDVIFSYYVSKFYDVDLNLLRTRTQMSDAMARVVTFNRNQCYSRGYKVAYKAIKGKWTPQRVRRALLKELAEMKS